MNPEEKAKDMIDYFIRALGIDCGSAAIAAERACDEVISEIEPDTLFHNYNERVTYWKDVKEHVQSL